MQNRRFNRPKSLNSPRFDQSAVLTDVGPGKSLYLAAVTGRTLPFVEPSSVETATAPSRCKYQELMSGCFRADSPNRFACWRFLPDR